MSNPFDDNYAIDPAINKKKRSDRDVEERLLEQMSDALGDLKETAIDITGKLDEHNRDLEDVQIGTETNTGDLSNSTNKLKRFLNDDSSKIKFICIGILIFIVFVLFIVIIYLVQ